MRSDGTDLPGSFKKYVRKMDVIRYKCMRIRIKLETRNMRRNDTHFFPDNRITVKYFCRISLPTLPSLETVNYEYTEALHALLTPIAQNLYRGVYLLWGIISSIRETELKLNFHR